MRFGGVQVNKKRRRRFTREFKLEAVRMVTEGGHEVSQVAKDLDLRPDMLRRWQEKQEAEAEAASKGERSGDELRQLRRECDRLRMERDILKKAVAIFSDPRR
jgi:transposase